MITPDDVKVVNYAEFNLDSKETELISNHTVNTWQIDRSVAVKKSDTSIGKTAEMAFIKYTEKNLVNFEYLPYDRIRNDNFLKHAPFDGLIFRKNIDRGVLNSLIKDIISQVSTSGTGQIDDQLKQKCLTSHVYIVEIKSTRVAPRHFSRGVIDLQKILTDDFLDYPKYLRTDTYNSINDLDDYLYYVNRRFSSHFSKEDILVIEKNNMKHIYVRVYIDEANSQAYIIGCISNNGFIRNCSIKKMPQKNKSEYAVYLACGLVKGNSIDILDRLH